MYGVGHAIQAGVNQEVFTARDMQSRFNTIDMLGLTDNCSRLKTIGPGPADREFTVEEWRGQPGEEILRDHVIS